MAHLTIVASVDAKGRVEDDLTRARDALAVVEEDRRRLEAEVACLAIERTSLLLELEASKDEVSSLHSQTGKDKKAMEEDYQKALEQIFAYGYGCSAFKHNIYGDLPRIPDGMPDSVDPLIPEFFVNPGCLLAPTAIKAKVEEVHLGEATKDLVEDVVVEEQG